MNIYMFDETMGNQEQQLMWELEQEELYSEDMQRVENLSRRLEDL